MQHESTHESRFHLEYANSVKKQRRWLMFPHELTHCRTSCSPFSRHHPRDPRFHDSGKQFSSFFRVFSFLRVSPPSSILLSQLKTWNQTFCTLVTTYVPAFLVLLLKVHKQERLTEDSYLLSRLIGDLRESWPSNFSLG